MKQLYLLGHPVAHSLSPAIQNVALRALNLDYEYHLMPVSPEELGRRVDELRDPSVVGFNVTIPHKVAVMPLLDKLDNSASTVGAVNTVVNHGGLLVGHNTDSVASTHVLQETYGDLAGCRVVILGAGGAARAVASGLAPHAEKITILARDESKAKSLVEHMRAKNQSKIQDGSFGEVTEIIHSADVLVNATPVGMHPNIDASPVEAHALHAGLLVFDLIYNPERTRLLMDAEATGARAVGGLKMLVYQGAEAFRLWTGREAPEKLMMGAARAALGGVTS
jgi:shikimate dehydrogenase